MKHHEPTHAASDDAFEDQPTGTWRVIPRAPDVESEPEETEPARPDA